MNHFTDAQARSTAFLHQVPDSVDRPLITIATVVRNGATTLDATIRSVASQTFTNMEYIVVDGCSTDGTLNILQQHETHITTWISESDTGIYDAMNKALALARGRWLLFLGADDTLIAPDVLERVASQLNDESSVCYGDVILKSSSQPYCGKINTYRLMQQNICHQAIFYPAAVFQSKLYDLNAGLLADYKYNIELWGAGVPFRYMSLAISVFEDAGASSKPDTKFESMRLMLIDQHLGRSYGLVKRIRNLMVRARNLMLRP